MGTTRDEQAEQRRTALMDAALAVFAAKGVDGASIKNIAAEAGVTPGLVYHYFESKTHLVTTVLRERGFGPRLRELLAEAADKPATEVLSLVVGGFQQVLADNAQLVELFFGASRSNDEIHAAMGDFVRDGRAMLADYLRSRAEAGELRPHDAEVAATALFATVAMGVRTATPIDAGELVRIVLLGTLVREGDFHD
ncbi:TetR/AcrR family transcriptional regulator [Nocardia sp. NPDC050712]|uniref:TetR/AcrR family transcriptional regulator n=1 Tax=Nocardia sp. NPDC050712 TaxID=3155518 RepID=UPI0033FB11EE